MPIVPVSVAIKYTRARSYEEALLSNLSCYFNLNGRYAVVVQANQVRFEESQVSCIAAKVVSYLILFPLTVPLFVVNLGLRYRQEFSLYVPSQAKKKIKNVQKRIVPLSKPEAKPARPAKPKTKPASAPLKKSSRGKRVEDDVHVYYPKRVLLGGFIYVEQGGNWVKPGLFSPHVMKGGKKKLIAVDKMSDGNYCKAKGTLMSALERRLREELDSSQQSDLEEILSGPVDCELFIEFLFTTKGIFALSPSSLELLLPIIEEKGLLEVLDEYILQQESIDFSYTKEELHQILSGGAIDREELITFLNENKLIARFSHRSRRTLLGVLKELG